MKTAFANDRALTLSKLATLVLTLVGCDSASAQQGGYSSQEFYRQGDAFSEKVSGFFSRLFKADSQPTGYQQQPYAQPGAYRTPAPASAASPRNPSTYSQASGTRTRSTTAAWPGYAQPQAPNYRTPPPVKSTSTTSSLSAKKSSATTSTRKPIFSSSTKTKTPEVRTETPYTAPKESVVKAPTQENSPYSLKPAEPDPLPLPKQSFSDSSNTSTTSTGSTGTSQVSSNQSFPMATPSKTPGRVISPYSPNKELDVKGLASGSLALDPTTQKVFKVP